MSQATNTLTECTCVVEEDERSLRLAQMPDGEIKAFCRECGLETHDEDPQTWRDLAEAAIMDLRRYADDELPHRRLVSARAYEARFALLDGLPSPTP
jgi:hypothetical protein